MSDEPFDIAWTATSRRALSKLPDKVGTAVVELCYGPLADNPARLGKPLRFELEGLHCARRGDYRVIYRIDLERHRIEIVAIDHRSTAYRSR
ncbi:MAG: type II toxin-antitoxin system RelE/ParE family toxin [Actinomycetota bacterium]